MTGINGSSRQAIQEKIDQYTWFHSIDFGNGLSSKGVAPNSFLKQQADAIFDGIGLRSTGVLDIGAWNGFYSFEATRRGASRVVASDKFAWTHDVYKGRETFELGRELLGLDIEAVEIDVPQIKVESVGAFDVVLFLGVFYHLFDAQTLTKQIAACAEQLLIVETHQDALEFSRPAMIFYPGSILGNDPTNWWGPNPNCIYEVLRECGFERIFYQDHPDTNFSDRASPNFRGRGIFHAFRTDEAVRRLAEDGPSSRWMDLGIESVRQALFKPLLTGSL